MSSISYIKGVNREVISSKADRFNDRVKESVAKSSSRGEVRTVNIGSGSKDVGGSLSPSEHGDGTTEAKRSAIQASSLVQIKMSFGLEGSL